MEAPGWFTSPDLAFRPGAFWFWHHIPDEREIADHLAEIAASGLGTIMIQARLALPLADYLSPQWLAAYRFACTEATQLGLQVEIYDEYNWMSGHGGGRTVAGADHLRERHLFWLTVPTGKAGATFTDIRSPWLEFLGPAGLDWCYETGRPLWDQWEFVAVVGHDAEGVIDLTAQARIASSDDAGCTVEIAADFPVTVFVAARCISSRLINYLMPEAAERFAETVYRPLVEAAGGVARSTFFDHPYAGFYRWQGMSGPVGNSLLWDARLPELLGPEPLAAQLAALVDPEASRIRARFFEIYQNRLHEAFFGTLRHWCDREGIGFSGHELLTHVGAWGLHDGLTGIDPRSMPGVDYFGVDRYRTSTSVDAADYRPQLSAKLGDSVARASGRSRCTLEQYSTGREIGMPGGAGQWGLTLERLRAQSIRHTLQGARRIILHALWLTDGFAPDQGSGANPRFDFAPGFNFEPWWQDAPPVLTEIARLSAFLEDGTPIRPVALFYPLETIRAEGPPSACGHQFGLWAEALTLAGIGFDIVDESAFAEARIDDGKLVLPTGAYTTLVMPAVTHLGRPSTAATIATFAASGGRLFEGAEQPDIAALEQPLIRFETGPTFATAARLGETTRLAIFNDQPEHRRAQLRLPDGLADLVRWHPETGTCDTMATGLTGNVTIDIAAHALLCLEVRPGTGQRMPVPATHPDLPAPIEIPQGWTLSIGGEARPIATTSGWERQGFESFAGTGIYRRMIDLPPVPEGADWYLVCPQLAGTAECFADGATVGRHVAGEVAFRLGQADSVAVELHIRNSAANRYYPGTIYEAAANQPSGLTRPPRLEARTAAMAADILILT